MYNYVIHLTVRGIIPMNITKKKSILILYTVLAFVLAFMLTVWRTMLLKQYYDPYDGTFDVGSGKIFVTFEYLLLLSVIILGTGTFFAKKISFSPIGKRYSTASLAVCVTCGIILISIGLISLLAFADELFFIDRINTFATKIGTLISFLMIFLVGAYFFMGASSRYKDKQIKYVFSFIIPIFAIFCIIASYFNVDFVYNDFNRITCHISILSIMFFALSESKLMIGKDGYAFNFISSLIAIVCISSYIFPLITLAAFGKVNFEFVLFFESYQIAFFIYAVASAISALRSLCAAPEKVK